MCPSLKFGYTQGQGIIISPKGAMLTKHLLALILALLACLNSSARASYVREALPLPQIIAQAEVVVVASLAKYTPDSKNQNQQETTKDKGNFTFGGENSTDEIRSGIYTFRVLQTVKGQWDGTLQLSLPHYYYSTRFGIKEGSQVLLFLRSDAKRNWMPVDPLVPLIRLGENTSLNDNNADEDSLSRVVALVLASLIDPVLRRENTYRLRFVVDPRIPKALSTYIDDPDITTQGNVLYSLATNQQVSAIPYIATSQAKMSEKGSGTETVVALQQFKIPEAVRYLNPLLFEADEYTRINTAITLQRLADRSSIPYLMLALRDPETQNVVAYSAYRILHRLVPALGSPRDPKYFEIQREAEARRVYVWWKDELAGKRVQTPQAGEQVPKPEAEISTLSVEKLNPLLFEPIADIRRKTVAILEKRADRSSIPYLILALIDPDGTIAYRAYVTLHRLIPALGAAKSREYFETNREPAIRPIYIWWEDELTGNHVPLPKEEPPVLNTKNG